MAEPAISTVPRVGRSSPPSSCSSVVLPDPEAPTMAMRSPGTHSDAGTAQHLRFDPALDEFLGEIHAFEHHSLNSTSSSVLNHCASDSAGSNRAARNAG